jgi:acyl-CoA synthetase (AMP-forming)/AMP-acid ligase II
MVTNNARLFPDKVGIIDGQTGDRYTWREVNRRVNSISNGLIDLGVKKGDRIGLISQNSLECGEFQFAVAKTGAIGCGLNYRLQPKVIEELIRDAGMKALFVQSQYSGLINSIRANLKTVEHFVGIGHGHGYQLDYESFIKQYPDKEVRVDVKEDDPVVISYSSGTTGIPKGVIITHKNRITFCLENCLFSERYDPDDIVSVSAPWCAGAAGQVQFLAPAVIGATIVIHILGPTWAEVVERERVTVAMMTKSRFMPVWDHIKATGKKYDLSSLRKVTLGAEAITPEDIKRIMDFCGVSYSAKAYGISETSACVTRLLPHDVMAGLRSNATEKEKKRLESVGKPLLSTRIRLVDGQGEDVPQGQIGEVIIKGDCVSLGYWNNPELTRERFKDGWYYTSDMGIFDEDGYLYLKGRKDFIIKTGGFLVSPIEVENVILTHPAVKEVAVIGVPDERWSEAIRAIVSLREGCSVTEEELRKHCREHLAGFQIPKSFLFTEKLPRDEAGRVQLKELRKLFGAPG